MIEAHNVRSGFEVQKVGAVINFRGLTYAPVNEQGVVFLFSKINDDLQIKIESIQEAFPDAIGIDYRTGRDIGLRKRIEFEFLSSNYDHPVDGCDIIVCWEHDWKDCPDTIEVIELKSELSRLGSVHLKLPKDIEDFIKSRRPQKDIEEVFRKLIQEIERLSSQSTKKIKKTAVSYKTHRPFVTVELRKTCIILHLTLRTKPKDKSVRYARIVYGNKAHCHIFIRNLSEAESAMEYCKRAYEDSLK
jgi:predicted transport protein